MDLLSGMRLFARVVETGGFTVVARENSTSQPTISRTIAALEAHLDVRLLNRSSRAVTLTDDGRQFYERARGALEAVAEAEGSVGRRRGQPGGLLRLGRRWRSAACTSRRACRHSSTATRTSRSNW